MHISYLSRYSALSSDWSSSRSKFMSSLLNIQPRESLQMGRMLVSKSRGKKVPAIKQIKLGSSQPWPVHVYLFSFLAARPLSTPLPTPRPQTHTHTHTGHVLTSSGGVKVVRRFEVSVCVEVKNSKPVLQSGCQTVEFRVCAAYTHTHKIN